MLFKISTISKTKIKLKMLNKIFIVNFLILNTESKAIIKANEKNFPSFASLTDGKELLINQRQTAPS